MKFGKLKEVIKMKAVELTDRERIILMCLVRTEEIKRQQENWKLDGKTEKFTDDEIKQYDINSQLLLELSVLTEKLKD